MLSKKLSSNERTMLLIKKVSNSFQLCDKTYFYPIKHTDSLFIQFDYPPASEESREVANLTERKIHIPPYMVSKVGQGWEEEEPAGVSGEA